MEIKYSLFKNVDRDTCLIRIPSANLEANKEYGFDVVVSHDSLGTVNASGKVTTKPDEPESMIEKNLIDKNDV